MTPQISIILPTYNRADVISRAVESGLAQSFAAWELIIVDDGSSDNTIQIVKKYLADSRIEYFFQTNQGVIQAMNFGLSKTRAEIVTFLGSDDRYKPSHLLTNFHYLSANPAIDLIHSNTEVVGSALVPDYTKPGATIHLDECYIEGTFFIRRRLLNKLAFTDSRQIAGGYRFIKSATEQGFVIKKINTRTYVYDRSGSQSLTKQAEVNMKKYNWP